MNQVLHSVLCPRIEPFSFKWTIENFSLLQNQDIIISDQFTVNGPEPTKWELWLFPMGHSSSCKPIPGFMSLYINHLFPSDNFRVTASFSHSIQSTSGEDYSHDGRITTFSNSMGMKPVWGCQCFIETEELKKRSSELLPNDTLTLVWEGSMMLDKEKREEKLEAEGPSLIQDIEHMWNSNDKDVLLVSKDKSVFHVHKFILCARSPVFAQESMSGRVDVKDLDLEVVRGMVYFMYNDNAPEDMTDEFAMELMSAAGKYQIHRLESLCELHLAKAITVANVTDILRFALKHGSSALKEACIRFVQLNRDEVQDSRAFKDCKDVEVMRIIAASMLPIFEPDFSILVV